MGSAASVENTSQKSVASTGSTDSVRANYGNGDLCKFSDSDDEGEGTALANSHKGDSNIDSEITKIKKSNGIPAVHGKILIHNENEHSAFEKAVHNEINSDIAADRSSMVLNSSSSVDKNSKNPTTKGKKKKHKKKKKRTSQDTGLYKTRDDDFDFDENAHDEELAVTQRQDIDRIQTRYNSASLDTGISDADMIAADAQLEINAVNENSNQNQRLLIDGIEYNNENNDASARATDQPDVWRADNDNAATQHNSDADVWRAVD